VADVAFRPRAQRDINAIWAYMAAHDPRTADAFVSRETEKCELAARFPAMGPARPEIGPSTRILLVRRYVIVYEPRPGGIDVIAIVHGARDPDTWLD
jgi:toxin ParE1/3/4